MVYIAMAIGVNLLLTLWLIRRAATVLKILEAHNLLLDIHNEPWRRSAEVEPGVEFGDEPRKGWYP